MAKTQNYSAETRGKAIRLVREHAGDYDSEYAAIRAVAGRLGMSAETLRKWLRQSEIDAGSAPGVTTEEAAQVRQLRRKVAELERTIENPLGRDGFLRAGARPATGLTCQFIDAFRHRFGVVPICRALSAQGLAIAPRTYWARRKRPPSARALRDAVVTRLLASVFEPGKTAGRRRNRSMAR